MNNIRTFIRKKDLEHIQRGKGSFTSATELFMFGTDMELQDNVNIGGEPLVEIEVMAVPPPSTAERNRHARAKAKPVDITIIRGDK